MSPAKSTDNNKNEQKSEPQYLTLADKKPSLIVVMNGNKSTSTKTISTRELSENLQKTRDGLINLKRKQKGNYGQDTYHGSESSNFGMPVRVGKKLRKDGGLDGSSFLSRERKGKHSNSDDFNLNSDENNDGKYGQGFNDRSGKNSKKINKKLLKSQNPKKDGPLTTRIFIDAFLPSLEGNRIFPLFNHRCAEKIERERPDYNATNIHGLNKQLAAVSSTEKCIVYESSEDIRTIHKGDENGSIEEILGDESETEHQI